MRVISVRTLREHWERRPDSEQQLRAWYHEAKDASWSGPAELKAQYGTASVLRDGRVVFNICGNKYRLVVWINYEFWSILTAIPTQWRAVRVNTGLLMT